MKIPALVLAAALAPLCAQAQTAPVADGVAAWERIYAVVSHPRCTNCHVGGDGRPGWDGLGYGDARLHGMNVTADESRIGVESMLCSACHIGAAGRNDVPHAAPQLDDTWRLPPVELAWRGQPADAICTELRSLMEGDSGRIPEHVRTSAFVQYGFVPGITREGAPGSVEILARDFEAWNAAGAPCPAPQ